MAKKIIGVTVGTTIKPSVLAEKLDLTDYYTIEQTNNKFATKEELKDVDVDLTAYSTTQENDAKYQPKGDYLTSVPTEVAVQSTEPTEGVLWIDTDSSDEVILAEIDDNSIDNEKTWSSNKINKLSEENVKQQTQINDHQEQLNNKLEDIDIVTQQTDTGAKITVGTKTVILENGKDGTIQIEPLFAESVEWLQENGDTSKVYILPNNVIYAYQWTEGTEPSYKNWREYATDTDHTTIYNGIGYKDSLRLNSSGVEKDCAGMMVTGFIPCKKGDIVRIKGWVHTTTTYTEEICFYNSSNAFLGYAGVSNNLGMTETSMQAPKGWTYTKEDDGTFSFTIDTSKVSCASNIGDSVYMRIACGNWSNAIITINEEISGSSGTASGYQWSSTGHTFIPSDYEDRIIALEKKTSESGLSSVQDYLNKRNTYIAPVPSGYCESLNTYSDYSVKINDAVSLETQMARFSALATSYPNYVTETLLGKDASNTYDIYKYELDLTPPIGEGYSSVMSKNKPVFIITAGLHGIEHDAVDEVYFFMKDLCENYMDSDYFDYLRNNVKFVIVPISNPWGYVNLTYNNSNDVNLNKNFEHGFSYVASTTGSQLNTGANAYSEVETVLLKGVFDEYKDAIFHLECHGKATNDTEWGTILWFSNMASLESDVIELCSTRVIHQIGCRLHKLGFNNDTSEVGWITYYTLNGRPKDYTGTEYGMLSTTMEGTGRMGVAGHTTYTKHEQRINCEALENFVLRVLDALNSRVEI